MHAIRLRLHSFADWGIAAALLAATLTVGFLIVHEFRALGVPAPAPAREDRPTTLPAVVPSMAVSVPSLSLGEGVEIKIGDPQERVATLVGRAAEIGAPVVDRGRLGPRTTRFYQIGSTRFLVVFEPFERQGAPRVTAIYIQ
jgi:hypothetical protein